MSTERSDSLVLFGITGDLARKKLFGALYNLAARDLLPPVVVGVASSKWDLPELRHHARTALEENGVAIDDETWRQIRAVADDFQTYEDSVVETVRSLDGELGR